MRSPDYYATNTTLTTIGEHSSYTTSSSAGQVVYIDGSTVAQRIRREQLRVMDENLDRILQEDFSNGQTVIRGFDALRGFRGYNEDSSFHQTFDFWSERELQEKIALLFSLKNVKERKSILRRVHHKRISIIDFLTIVKSVCAPGWSRNIIRDSIHSGPYFQFHSGDKLYFSEYFGSYYVSGFDMGKGTAQSSTVRCVINDLLKS